MTGVEDRTREEPPLCNGSDLTFLFDDAYWDDAFGTLYDPAMRVCSIFGC